MRRLWVLMGFALCACDATGGTQGGESLLGPDPCEATDGGHTWSDLYTCYFGPAGKASCTAQAACHGAPEQAGALSSSYVCGTTKDSCAYGMTHGYTTCDGGEDAGCFVPQPIVPAGGTSDPTTTKLWTALSGASGPGLHNMPCAQPGQLCQGTPAYTFTPDDLARISAWIKDGAQDN